MKKVLLTGAIVASLAATPALASSKKNAAYTACKNEVLATLGDDTRVSLRKIRKSGANLKITMRIRQAGEDTMTVACIHGKDTLAFETRDKQPLELVALNEKSDTETAIN